MDSPGLWLKVEPNNAADTNFIISYLDGWRTATKGMSVRLNSYDQLAVVVLAPPQ